MKIRETLMVAALVVLSTFAAYAGGESTEKPFNLNRDADIYVEEANGSVEIHVYIKDKDQFETVTIEKSKSYMSNYSEIKEIPEAELLGMNGDYLTKTDSPYSSGSTYYRISTIDKTGVMRFYPAFEVVAAN